MSQQEFVPKPQQQPENEEEIYAPQYPYSWTGKSSAEAAPRDEPPSSYEYEAGYQAQDAYTPDAYEDASSFDAANPYSQPVQQTQQAQQQQQQQYQYNPYDNNAYGQGNDPYNYKAAQNTPYQQGVPPYARPQQQSFSPWRFSSILLILVIISILSTVGRGFFFYGGHGLDWIFGMFFPFFILLLIFNGIRRGGRRRYRRGPWGW